MEQNIYGPHCSPPSDEISEKELKYQLTDCQDFYFPMKFDCSSLHHLPLRYCSFPVIASSDSEPVKHSQLSKLHQAAVYLTLILLSMVLSTHLYLVMGPSANNNNEYGLCLRLETNNELIIDVMLWEKYILIEKLAVIWLKAYLIDYAKICITCKKCIFCHICTINLKSLHLK